MDKRDLVKFKEDIEKLERQIATDEGSLSEMMKALKVQGYDSVKGATQALKKMEDEIADMESNYQSKLDEIETAMEEWDGA